MPLLGLTRAKLILGIFRNWTEWVGQWPLVGLQTLIFLIISLLLQADHHDFHRCVSPQWSECHRRANICSVFRKPHSLCCPNSRGDNPFLLEGPYLLLQERNRLPFNLRIRLGWSLPEEVQISSPWGQSFKTEFYWLLPQMKRLSVPKGFLCTFKPHCLKRNLLFASNYLLKHLSMPPVRSFSTEAFTLYSPVENLYSSFEDHIEMPVSCRILNSSPLLLC